MARANRVRGQGGIFHVTHRCHNGRFLLRFARDRDSKNHHVLAVEKLVLANTRPLMALGNAGARRLQIV